MFLKMNSFTRRPEITASAENGSAKRWRGCILLKRLLLMIPTLFGILVVSFLVIRLAPGDPAATKFGGAGQAAAGMNADRGTEAAEKRYRQRLGLDQPLHVQFGMFLKRLVTLDMISFQSEQPIWKEIWAALESDCPAQSDRLHPDLCRGGSIGNFQCRDLPKFRLRPDRDRRPVRALQSSVVLGRRNPAATGHAKVALGHDRDAGYEMAHHGTDVAGLRPDDDSAQRNWSIISDTLCCRSPV